jgi:hypothetical protein
MQRSSFDGTVSRAVVTFAVAIATVSVGPSVRADVVGPPPDECPDGSLGGSSHCGPYCSPDRCTGDDDCEGDTTCQEVPLCVEVLECMSNGGPFTQEAVTDTCEGGGGCDDESTCQTLQVCAPPEVFTSVQRAGCGCAAPGRGAAGGAALAVLLAAALIAWGRRGRA